MFTAVRTVKIVGDKKLRVLIIAVSPANEGLFVPLIYGNLRSWADQDRLLRESVEWQDPIILPTDAEDVGSPDVIGLSIYEWNADHSYELCRAIKAKLPNCVTVVGGPQAKWRDARYFDAHPYVDAVIPGDGEQPFSGILRCCLESTSLQEAEGVILNPALGQSEYRPLPPLDTSKRPSPWLSLKDFWREYFRKYSQYRLAASFETSRGCPYACVYCDWGGASKGRISFVPEETAIAEMDFIQHELKPFFMFWTDGNLGINPRDVRLAEHFADNKLAYGSPFSLYYNCNKSNIDTNLEIAQHLRRAKLLTKYVLALQHTDVEVLSNIGRRNLSPEMVGRLAEHMRESDIPLLVQLILGCPGDSFQKLLHCYGRLMEQGIHGEYRAYPFGLFPNASAAFPDYVAKWQLDAQERVNYVPFFTLKKHEVSMALSRSRYVMGSVGMSREEYGDTLRLSLMVCALHDHGFTRFIAIGMRAAFGMPYEEFYGRLFSWFYASIYSDETERFIHSWLYDPQSAYTRRCALTDTFMEPEEALVLELYAHYDDFYAALAEYAHSVGIPDSLLRYQRDMLYRVDTAPESKLTLPSQWARFFDPALDDSGVYRVKTELLRFPGIWYKERDSRVRYRKFYSQLVQHNVPGSKRAVFKQLSAIK